MVRRALSFLVRQGPVSDQDRWEEDAGLNTFTLAVCIAALVAGAAYLPRRRPRACARFRRLLERAARGLDGVRDTPLARLYGVPGYYVRVAPPQALTATAARPTSVLPISNLRLRPEPAGERAGRRRFPAAGALRAAPRRGPADRRRS